MTSVALCILGLIELIIRAAILLVIVITLLGLIILWEMNFDFKEFMKPICFELARENLIRKEVA